MKRTTLLLVSMLALVVAALPAAAAPPEPALAPLHEATGETVDGHYIVVLDGGAAAATIAARLGVEPLHVYEHALHGFAAELTAAELEAVRRHPAVAFVEHDEVATVLDQPAAVPDQPAAPDQAPQPPQERSGGVEAQRQCQRDAPWNLIRIAYRNPRPFDSDYCYGSAANVDIYVIGTGIQWDHPRLPKVMAGYDAFGGNSYDCNGMGTLVAGIASSPLYGAAKDTYLWSVRALDCSGSGSYAGVIAATDWVRQHAASWPDYPAVANYALGGGYSVALNHAVNNLSHSGVFVSVPAGDSGVNACNFSPASASTAMTVAASTSGNQRATSSNHGSCVDIYAPGAWITGPWPGGGTRTASGTVLASPHAAGVAALYKGYYGDQPSSVVRNWIIAMATTGVIQGNPAGTPNRLLYKAHL